MSEQQHLEKVRIWNSKLARRIVPIAVALVAVPIVLTVLILGKVGRDQIVRTTNDLQTINSDAIADAGSEFQRLGRGTLRNSTKQTGDISAAAVHGFSDRQQTWQSQYLKSTADDFNKLTRASLADWSRKADAPAGPPPLSPDRRSGAGEERRSARDVAQGGDDAEAGSEAKDAGRMNLPQWSW